MPTQQAQHAAGDKIGKYLVIEPLGAGAAAAVYRAEDTESGEIRAIKVLGQSARDDENLQRRFIREIAVMQKVRHENLVQIYEAGLHEDTLFYSMEVVDSGTLKDVLTGPLPWRDVAECAIQLAAALAVLQENDIVHRDFKPGNIYLSSSGRIKLGDFGLVRDLQSSRLTAEGMTMGTVLYMAPEQIRGDDQLTGSADLYALGCVLYQMITGNPPFIGEHAMQVLNHHIKTPPPNPCDIAPDCPQDLSLLIQLLMSKKVQDRPPDSQAVAAALQKILGKEGEGVDVACLSSTSALRSAAHDSSAGSIANEISISLPAIPTDFETPSLTARLKQSQRSQNPSISTAKLVIVFVGLAALVGLVMIFKDG